MDADTECDGVLSAEELRAAMPLQQVRQLPGAEANAELRRRGLWPLTAQEVCLRLGLPAQGLGAAADHRFASGFGGLGLKSSTRVTLPILLTKLCKGMAGLLNKDGDVLWDGTVARFKPATPASLPARFASTVVARSKLALGLVNSLALAMERDAKKPELAQILSPLVAQFSLRVFNESYTLQLDGKQVSKHLWSMARTHLALWHAAQSAEPGKHQRLRLSFAHLQVSHVQHARSRSAAGREPALSLRMPCPAPVPPPPRSRTWEPVSSPPSAGVPLAHQGAVAGARARRPLPGA